MLFKNSSKINKIRGYALILVFIGVLIMYVGLLFRSHFLVMSIFMLLGFIAILLSSGIYMWVGMLSTKTIPVTCPSCQQSTKMLGRVDICTHCNEPLTLDPDLDGKPFDKKYNRKSTN